MGNKQKKNGINELIQFLRLYFCSSVVPGVRWLLNWMANVVPTIDSKPFFFIRILLYFYAF